MGATPRFTFKAAFATTVFMFATLLHAANCTIKVLSPGIEAITFSSRVLRKRKTFCVVTPPKAKPNRDKWPVLVILHGRGRNERSLLDDAQTKEILLAASVITILPDGDDGWYINSPAMPHDRYNDYLEEVLKTVSAICRLNPDSTAWGISGWSMGGYGCMMFAQSHPEQFAAVVSVIGLLDFPRDGLPDGQRYAIPTQRFGKAPDAWKRLNPITHVERLRGRAVLIITADQAFDRTMNEHFHARLDESGIGHRYIQLSGGHTFATVRHALPHVLDFMKTSLDPQGTSGK